MKKYAFIIVASTLFIGACNHLEQIPDNTATNSQFSQQSISQLSKQNDGDQVAFHDQKTGISISYPASWTGSFVSYYEEKTNAPIFTGILFPYEKKVKCRMDFDCFLIDSFGYGFGSENFEKINIENIQVDGVEFTLTTFQGLRVAAIGADVSDKGILLAQEKNPRDNSGSQLHIWAFYHNEKAKDFRLFTNQLLQSIDMPN